MAIKGKLRQTGCKRARWAVLEESTSARLNFEGNPEDPDAPVIRTPSDWLNSSEMNDEDWSKLFDSFKNTDHLKELHCR